MAKAKTKTTEDGWGCVPELKQAVNAVNKTNDICYEINNCVRAHYLDHMVVEMKWALQEALEILEGIDPSEEFITVDEDDEDDYDALYNATRGIPTVEEPNNVADPFYKNDSYLD
jgi:hypothetical protein